MEKLAGSTTGGAGFADELAASGPLGIPGFDRHAGDRAVAGRLSRRQWLRRCGGLLAVVGLPVAGHALRQGGPDRCAFDGETIEPSYRVRIAAADGQKLFCCVGCASRWLERSPASPEYVFVTDEIGGDELPAAEAIFVRSTIFTRPSTRDRVHVFRRIEDAERHAREFRGRVLSAAARPL